MKNYAKMTRLFYLPYCVVSSKPHDRTSDITRQKQLRRNINRFFELKIIWIVLQIHLAREKETSMNADTQNQTRTEMKYWRCFSPQNCSKMLLPLSVDSICSHLHRAFNMAGIALAVSGVVLVVFACRRGGAGQWILGGYHTLPSGVEWCARQGTLGPSISVDEYCAQERITSVVHPHHGSFISR